MVSEEGVPEIASLRTPEARERYIESISQELPEGGTFPHRKDVVLWHGTSVFALRYAIAHGVLPGQPAASELHEKGALFAIPEVSRIPYARDSRRERKPSAWLSRHIPSSEAAEPDYVILYAKLAAQRHYMMDAIGIPFDDALAEEAVQHLLIPDDVDGVSGEVRIIGEVGRRMRTIIDAYGIDVVKNLISKALKQEGVVIGIKRSAIIDNPHLKAFGLGDHGEGDVKLDTGSHGLDVSHVGVIYYQGDGQSYRRALSQKEPAVDTLNGTCSASFDVTGYVSFHFRPAVIPGDNRALIFKEYRNFREGLNELRRRFKEAQSGNSEYSKYANVHYVAATSWITAGYEKILTLSGFKDDPTMPEDEKRALVSIYQQRRQQYGVRPEHANIEPKCFRVSVNDFIKPIRSS